MELRIDMDKGRWRFLDEISLWEGDTTADHKSLIISIADLTDLLRYAERCAAERQAYRDREDNERRRIG